jgi:hypothetical protein
MSTLLVAVLLTVVLAACGDASSPDSMSPSAGGQAGREPSFVITSTGMRVYQETFRSSGVRWACSAFTLPDGVHGTLQVTPGAADAVWIKADDGRHLYVAWPDDFKLRLEPVGAVLSGDGDILAEDDGPIRLKQTAPDSAAGTDADPYVASLCDFLH